MEALRLKGLKENLVGAVRTGVFLVRTMTERPSGRRNRGVRESRMRTGAGIEYDLYEPMRIAIRMVIAVSGLTLKGERDRRWMNFCRALAEAGQSG